MSAESRTRLRELAQKATPGPWAAIKSCSYCGPHVRAAGMEAAVVYGRSWSCARNGSDDVQYIAACDPQTVLGLLDIADAAEAAREALRMVGDDLRARMDAKPEPGADRVLLPVAPYAEIWDALARLESALGGGK